MKYLGIARTENGRLIMPDGFDCPEEGTTFEAVEIGGEIVLSPTPLDRRRLEKIDRLARQSMQDHRESLEDLAK